jgi:ABC-type dipeptide/oligopeptide/nickel transport system permease component
MELKIPVKEGAETKTMLKIVNCFINNLTDVELDIVSAMINKGYTTLSKNNRSELRSSLNMDKYLFNNYVKYLKDKKVLYLNEEVLTLNPNIVRLTSDNQITIILKKYGSA